VSPSSSRAAFAPTPSRPRCSPSARSKWVARPGTSLHRLGTELDLGPPTAYGWLAANAPRFGFKKRYSWEPWHFGYVRSAGTRSVGYGPGDGKSGLPSFVPARFAPAISRAAQRWNVGAAVLAAQLYAESNFNPFARSPAGAQGIAQFMPGTARAYGLKNPFDPDEAIDAQAHLMHDLLRQFGSVPLALAAYNAGPAPVQRCGCIPPYPETRGYVARILGLLGGAGEAPAGGGLTAGWCGDVAAPIIRSMGLTVDDLAVRPLTAGEVLRMVELGVLPEHERVELLDGVLVEKPVKSPEHGAIQSRLLRWLAPITDRYRLWLDAPLVVPDETYLPEPDVAVLAPSDVIAHPRTALLAIEVSVTSQVTDLKRKPAHYAAAGVVEYWVVDVPGQRVERFTEPASGAFAARSTHRPPERLTPVGLGVDPLDLTDLFAGFARR
jgi:Uma2 family endonuclease